VQLYENKWALDESEWLVDRQLCCKPKEVARATILKEDDVVQEMDLDVYTGDLLRIDPQFIGRSDSSLNAAATEDTYTGLFYYIFQLKISMV
jgi:hypothetical protein